MGKEQVFKKILVAVDGSKGALNAAQLAARLARNEGSELLVLHVLDKLVLEELEKFM
ncbi:MAG: universal stress protein, partial [Aquificota bacterium]